jgi:GNAT superfamily N-acetyltransferase
MATLDSQPNKKAEAESKSDTDPSDTGGNLTEKPVYRDLTLADFLPQPTESCTTVEELNEFFNSTQIKQELHWFTHRDTLVRAFDRDDRELFHIRPQGTVVAAAMVWCKSRVLEAGQAQIRLIATHPDDRDHGFARMLVEACNSFARSWDQTEMIADVAEESPATKFWQASGFDIADTYTTDSGRTMLRMSRDI